MTEATDTTEFVTTARPEPEPDFAPAIAKMLTGTDIQNAAPDPVFALIERHRTAYAEWDRQYRIYSDLPGNSAAFREAYTAAQAPAQREVAALEVLLSVRPTTPDGLCGLIEYLPTATRKTTVDDGQSEEQRALDAIREGLLGMGNADPSKGCDAGLFVLEAEFLAADAVATAAADAELAAQDAYAEPVMPVALRVWRGDWIYTSIPRPDMTKLGNGTARQHPYGREEVEYLRANPCMAVYTGGTEGQRRPDGTLLRSDKAAQVRANTIVAAWDEWQSEISAAREAMNLPTLERATAAAILTRDTILRRILEMPARSVAGLGLKARIAMNMGCSEDLRREGLDVYGAAEADAHLFIIAGDALDMSKTASGLGSELLASGAAIAAAIRHDGVPDPQAVMARFDVSNTPMAQLLTLHDIAFTLGEIASAFGCQPRCVTGRPYPEPHFNAAGVFADWIVDVAGAMQTNVQNEARRRVPANADDRDWRIQMLARATLTNGDADEIVTFVRDVSTMMEA